MGHRNTARILDNFRMLYQARPSPTAETPPARISPRAFDICQRKFLASEYGHLSYQQPAMGVNHLGLGFLSDFTAVGGFDR